MKNTKILIGNFALKLLSEMYSRVGTLFIVIFIARIYGVENFAKYAVAFALANMFQIITDFGLHTIMIRDIAADKPNGREYFGKFIVLKMITSIIAFLALMLAGAVMNYDILTHKLIMIAAFWMLSNSGVDAVYSFLTAFEDFKTILINTLLYKTILYVVVFSGMFYGFSMLKVCSVIAFSSVLGLISGLTFVYGKYGNLKFCFDLKFIKIRLADAMPIAVGGVFTSIYMKIDTLMISKMKDHIQTGLYNSVFRIFDTLIIIPAIFQSIILPKFAQYHKSDKDRLKMSFSRAVLFIVMISMPISVVLFAKSQWVVLLLYGSEFLGAVKALVIISPSVTLIFASCIPAVLLIAENKQKTNTYINAAGLIFCITGNLFAIRHWGYLGSAVVLTFNQLMMCILLYYKTYKWIDYKYIFNNISKVIIAGLLMGLILKKIDFFNDYAVLFVSVSAYFLFLVGVGAIKTDEIRCLFSANYAGADR